MTKKRSDRRFTKRKISSFSGAWRCSVHKRRSARLATVRAKCSCVRLGNVFAAQHCVVEVRDAAARLVVELLRIHIPERAEEHFAVFAVKAVDAAVAHEDGVGVVMLAIAALICLLRVLSGAHFVRDVLAGAAFGLTFGFVGMWLL